MLARRLLATLPLVLVLLPAGHATAAGPDATDRLDRGQRAADGTRTRVQADGWEDGVVRRHVRLADVETTSANPQQQLTGVDVTVDLEAQTMTATASFAQAPTDADAVLGVGLGDWDGGTCVPSLVAVGGTVSTLADGQVADGTKVPVVRSAQGAFLSLTAGPHPALRATEFGCAFATLLPTDPQQPALSRAWAETLAEVHRPALTVETEELVVGARQGRWAELRVTVDNDSPGDAADVRLTASGAGVTVRQPTQDLGALAAGADVDVTLEVRLDAPRTTQGKGKKGKKGKAGKKARQAANPTPRPLTLTATATGAEPATATAHVAVVPPRTKPRKLAGTYWWGWDSSRLDTGWDNHAVWFVDDRWAHLGWAEGGRPRCSAKVKACVRYTWNARKGTVRIGKKRAKVTSTGFAFKHPGASQKIAFHPLALPRKGTTFQTDLRHQNFSGMCLLSCTASTTWLSLGKDGRFVRSSVSTGSWPGLGLAWGTTPPDERGSYRVVSTGVVELAFDDGTRERLPLGVQHDVSGRPNPVAEGVVLGDVNFYP